MKTQHRLLSIVAIAVVAVGTTAIAATALPPLMVSGPACGKGSARSYKWLLFEDRNGDGIYDFVVAGDCDGSVRGREWTASTDPFDPTPGDIPIGQIPIGVVVAANPDLSYQQMPTGLFTWTVTDRSPEGAVICTYERGIDMSLSSSCPPDGHIR